MTMTIGTIGNYYGNLELRAEFPGSDPSDFKYYWGIEDWNDITWEEIPKYLYCALLKLDKESHGAPTDHTVP